MTRIILVYTHAIATVLVTRNSWLQPTAGKALYLLQLSNEEQYIRVCRINGRSTTSRAFLDGYFSYQSRRWYGDNKVCMKHSQQRLRAPNKTFNELYTRHER
jgi:hypothetical protein